MQLSREARLVAGLTLLTVPTVMYGGITLLGVLTKGTAGLAPRGAGAGWGPVGGVPPGARARGGVGGLVPRAPGRSRCGGVTRRVEVARPGQRPGGGGWHRGRFFRRRLPAGLPVAPLLRGSKPRRRRGAGRRRVAEAAEWGSLERAPRADSAWPKPLCL